MHDNHNHAHSHADGAGAGQEHVVLDLMDLQQDVRTRPIVLASAMCLCCLLFIVYCLSMGSSLVLTQCAWLTVFALFTLMSAMTNIAVKRTHPTPKYSFGLARAPVLAVFSSTVLAILSAIFIIKEAFEHMLEPEDHVHAHPQLLYIPAVFVCCVAQLLAAYAVNNDAMQHVLTAAASSMLQEQAAEMSQTLCHMMPGLSRFLLPRLNALGLLCSSSALVACGSQYLAVAKAVWWADAVGAMCISSFVIVTMKPLSSYTGRILLQTTPSYLLTQIQRYLNEARTLEGVLEVTNANFWQLDFNRLAGTVVVRVRRDADEQMALAQITEKLSAAVSDLTVQIVKAAELENLSVDEPQSSVLKGSQSWNSFGTEQHSHSHNTGHGHSHDTDSAHGHGHSHAH